MKDLELYDILTMSNGKEYSVVRMLDLDDKTYYLLSEIDEDEMPNLLETKIVEFEGTIAKEVEDGKLLKELKELFISALDADV